VLCLARDTGDGGRVTLGPGGEPRAAYPWPGRSMQAALVAGMELAARALAAAGCVRLVTTHRRRLEYAAPGAAAGGKGGKGVYTDLPAFLSALRSRGARRYSLPLLSAHQMGTVRAGRAASTSAADVAGRLRGTANVWIADGSLLPTAPGVNPMATIQAAAAVVAAAIADAAARRRAAPHGPAAAAVAAALDRVAPPPPPMAPPLFGARPTGGLDW